MTRRRAKVLAYTGAAMTALIGGGFVMSRWWSVEWVAPQTRFVFLDMGAAGLVRTTGSSFRDRGFQLRPQRSPWRYIQWWPAREKVGIAGREVGTMNIVPLWIPLLATAVPTVFFFRAMRRRGPGQCQSCGYDLSGAPTGLCPECGRAQKKADEARAPSA